MANWIAMARAQAGLQGVPVKAGEGKLLVESPWDIVVELRSPEDRAVLARFDRTSGRWAFG